MGVKSVSHFLLRMLMMPWAVKSMAFRPFLVGMTQSNMSTPRAIASRRFWGVPTPMRYLGRSLGSMLHTTSIMSYITSTGSPTARPPMALPGACCSAT